MPINNIFPFDFSLSPFSYNIIFNSNEAHKIERKEGLDIKCDVDRLLLSNHELENKNKDLQTIINYIPFTIIQEEPKKLNDEPGCVICLYDFEIGQKVSALPCCHTFHTKCLDNWIIQKQFCPVCKYEVTLISILGADFIIKQLKKIKEKEELKSQEEKEEEFKRKKEKELKRQKEMEEEFKRNRRRNKKNKRNRRRIKKKKRRRIKETKRKRRRI